MSFFTIFSGCYNSAPFIERLFGSIKNQTYRDFEWIVFDDNSQDNTIELIQRFISENPDLSITFIKNGSNKGIKYSYLEALKIAKGKYLVQWDQDDVQKPNQLEIFKRVLSKIDNGNIAGVWALCEDQRGNLLGKHFPGYISIGNYFTHFRKYITKYGNNVKFNERMPCIKISKLKQLNDYVQTQYPMDSEELFPTFRWALLSMMGNKIIFINEVVRVYFINQGFITLSMQRSKKLSEGIMISNKHWINLFFKHLDYKSIFFKFSICKSYVYHGINSQHTLKTLIRNIVILRSKIAILTMYFPLFIYIKLFKKV